MRIKAASPDFPIDHVRAYYAARLRAPGVVFRAVVAETLTQWRLGSASRPVDFSGAEETFRAGVAEILAIRLEAAYRPLFQGLRRIEDRVAVLASVREDPYAPPPSAPIRWTSKQHRFGF